MKSSLTDKKIEYYLNDYGDAIPRFRIERSRGGQRTIWHERAKYGGMTDAKKYIESVWAH